MDAAVWTKRLFRLNIAQVALNSLLAVLLAAWYIGPPAATRTTSVGADGELLNLNTQPIASRQPVNAQRPTAQSSGAPPSDAQTSGAPSSGSAPSAASQDNASAAASSAIDQALAQADGPGPSGDATSAGVEDGASPGSGPSGGPPPLPTNPVSGFVSTMVEAIQAEGAKQGKDVTAFVPSQEALKGAVYTGDFFNEKTLTVLAQLRKGYEALGLTLPQIPDPVQGTVPFP